MNESSLFDDMSLAHQNSLFRDVLTPEVYCPLSNSISDWLTT